MKHMKQNTTILIALLTLIIGGGIGFYGGIMYQKNQRSTLTRQFAANGGTREGNAPGNFGGQNRAGFRPVSGEITSIDNTSMTVKMNDGSSKIVILSTTTTVNKAQDVGKDALKKGITVAVFGTQNADGSVTAQSIQLNPQVRAMPQVSPAR
ncbi:MAG: DUF5666 domain-containing protein [Candidatus Roizmanbacteria bacterium]|nr:DUF5666 domain-containing protein [Candidatus Roizmanbacteria bacterium]